MAEAGKKMSCLASTVATRWLRYVLIGEGCWEWIGAKDQHGYGRIGYLNRAVGAHRVGYELLVGPVPPGLWVLHRCDNPACVRPDHLFLGTHVDNMQDMARKGRQGWQRQPALALVGDRHISKTNPQALRRGERHPSAKLTESTVLEIRERFRAGESQCALARHFGVAQNAVYEIVRYKSWAHVA